MKFYCPLTKKRIEDLIENVVFPLTKGETDREKLDLELSKFTSTFSPKVEPIICFTFPL